MAENFEAMQEDPANFWEERYQAASPETSGRPGAVLRRFAEPLEPGRALELGCGKGDDAVWLGQQGWEVVAVEISPTALAYARANAERAGVAERLRLEQHDLTQGFPEGRFDLVVASFLAAFPPGPVYQRAAAAVAPGGHLLLVEHGSRPPWSSVPEDWHFRSGEEVLGLFELEGDAWERTFVGELEREVTRPEGEVVSLVDSVVWVRRR